MSPEVRCLLPETNYLNDRSGMNVDSLFPRTSSFFSLLFFVIKVWMNHQRHGVLLLNETSISKREIFVLSIFLLFSHSNGGENVRIILSAVLLIPIKLSSALWVKWCSTVLFFSFCLIETWDWNEWKAISQKSRFDHHFFLTFSECFLRFCSAVWEQLRWSDCTRILFFFPLLVGLSPQWKKKTYNLQSISATDYTRSKDRGKERERKGARLLFWLMKLGIEWELYYPKGHLLV